MPSRHCFCWDLNERFAKYIAVRSRAYTENMSASDSTAADAPSASNAPTGTDGKTGNRAAVRASLAKQHLDAFIDMRKKYEGRPKSREKWRRLAPGDAVIFSDEDGSRVVIMEVSEVLEFPSFRAAWEKLGASLLPGVTTGEEADAVYAKFYSKDDVLDGVLAIGMGPVTVLQSAKPQ